MLRRAEFRNKQPRDSLGDHPNVVNIAYIGTFFFFLLPAWVLLYSNYVYIYIYMRISESFFVGQIKLRSKKSYD
jgi:hypothetical protein